MGRKRPGSPFRWQVEIAGDVEFGPAFEDDVFNAIARPLERARDAGVQGSARRKWIEAEHIEELAADFRPPPLPIVEVVNALELIAGDRRPAKRQVVLEQLISFDRVVAGARRRGLSPRRRGKSQHKQYPHGVKSEIQASSK